MPEAIERDAPLYVTLRQDGAFWKPVAVHAARSEPAPGEAVIKGEARYGGRRLKQVQVRYGIEEYFVPEGEGRAIERPRQGEKVTILSRGGHA